MIEKIIQARLVFLLVLLGIDLLTKAWFGYGDGVVVNKGGVFGLLPSSWWGLLLIAVWVMITREWWESRGVRWWGMGLIVVGGVGNLIDRVFLGGVRDFIYYPVVELYGNVADVYLLVGVMLVVAGRMRSEELRN